MRRKLCFRGHQAYFPRFTAHIAHTKRVTAHAPYSPSPPHFSIGKAVNLRELQSNDQKLLLTVPLGTCNAAQGFRTETAAAIVRSLHANLRLCPVVALIFIVPD